MIRRSPVEPDEEKPTEIPGGLDPKAQAVLVRPMNPRRAGIVLAGVIALGLCLRGLCLAEITGHPGFTRPGLDPGYYDYWARALVSGDWKVKPPLNDPEIRSHPYFKPHGYTSLPI